MDGQWGGADPVNSAANTTVKDNLKYKHMSIFLYNKCYGF
jgi:hypothetical protein